MDITKKDKILSLDFLAETSQMKCPGQQNFMGIVAPEKKKSGSGKQTWDFHKPMLQEDSVPNCIKKIPGKKKIPKIGSKWLPREDPIH